MKINDHILCGVVIVAAGRGERAGDPEAGPKQYRTIGGKPVLTHTLQRFVDAMPDSPLVVVIHPDDEALFEDACSQLSPPRRVSYVFGSTTRQRSVLEGLRALQDTGVSHVLIQDSVRPFLSNDLLQRVVETLQNGAEGVLPVMPVTDTLKRGNGGFVLETVSRAALYAAQTPQAFGYRQILKAHSDADRENVSDLTDDASIAEWAGIPVTLVEGSAENVKLTLKKDIAMADEKLIQTLPDVRTGNGYDVHQLVEGDGVTLCGIYIPHDQKLSGHSDADVALHALTDALLATCGAGDIGDHFPPSDMQWKGAASGIFLKHAVQIVREHGGTILNADVTLIAEAPKIGPHRLEMRQNLADLMEISLDRCSVKATTNETIGFIGRREGIAAIATASVIYKGMD
ncbi:bifunctional 2-C-methyl-D-erythritol 4-phosphate cytidylyltransferase/2-C-methyl-D-erythritol 2,4-cyclodiphosphate synthase [Rhizobium sp. CFBP 8762]|uniref:bifunctional 2-C-methyl-D-erythritol 4-phosphate cytidylyltransferase/2-C-methyl-D-erythritol 2,4-cyclodiphosphate synthase n=1 Tax=Rhizobium sp. CFBP 8762 TaxID=2775279 RepID=UPI00177BAB14|nr:bifunctional 2-C-methyl-D-erythritol 4-phosphate cytidylyltransferase/2-C-methyl-D-erythritol 2,4-cyclodiphosphate synthase [Rhizobium sp. CFBP 8762]MBD8555664.1 bifunctional 2-C-methyl-D-erythritol 4-phosphate cytidylyltransferase/2-C-methyl-D-erythritol 2,4-cyclodiphosphate synthase [Rhizobium sp. CFBP 8762]